MGIAICSMHSSYYPLGIFAEIEHEQIMLSHFLTFNTSSIGFSKT